MRISTVSKMYVAAGLLLFAVIAASMWWQGSEPSTILDLLNENTRGFLTKTLFHVGGQPVRVLFVIKTLLFFLFLNITARVARAWLALLVRDNPRISKHREYVLARVITLAIYVVGVLVGIQIEGINFTTLAIVGGTLGVGVGFGLQSLVSNFVAGSILLIEQPIRLGDRIEFGDKTGEVVRIGSRSSSIRTNDNAVLIVPNSDFVTKQILNWTAGDPKIRISVPVSVAYGTDPEEVIRNLLDLANSHQDVMKDPVPSVVLSELAPHGLSFSLRVWTLTQAENFSKLRSDLYLLILRRFAEQKIEIPFEQLDLHVKSIEAPVSFSGPRS